MAATEPIGIVELDVGDAQAGLARLSQLGDNAAKYSLQIKGGGQKVFTTEPGLTPWRFGRRR